MDKYSRRQYFDRLCELRNDYRGLGPDDATSVISIEAMIEQAICLLERPSSPLIMILEGQPEAN